MSKRTQAFKDEIKRKIEEARASMPPTSASTINVSDRVNAIVVRNVGESNGNQAAISRQRVTIQQDGKRAPESAS